jgi:hypothetical protein
LRDANRDFEVLVNGGPVGRLFEVTKLREHLNVRNVEVDD